MSPAIKIDARKLAAALSRSVLWRSPAELRQLDVAASWVASADKNGITSTDVLTATRRESDPRGRAAYWHLYRVWRICDQLSALRNLKCGVDEDLLAPRKYMNSTCAGQQTRKSRRKRIGRVAPMNRARYEFG